MLYSHTVATKGSSERSWTTGLDLKPGPCYSCIHFRGWYQDGPQWGVWCPEINRGILTVFYGHEGGCWRLEREPGSDDAEPIPAAAMTMRQLYGSTRRRRCEWMPPY